MKALLEDVMSLPIKKLLLAKRKCFPANNQVQPVVIQNQVIAWKWWFSDLCENKTFEIFLKILVLRTICAQVGEIPYVIPVQPISIQNQAIDKYQFFAVQNILLVNSLLKINTQQIYTGRCHIQAILAMNILQAVGVPNIMLVEPANIQNLDIVNHI